MGIIMVSLVSAMAIQYTGATAIAVVKPAFPKLQNITKIEGEKGRRGARGSSSWRGRASLSFELCRMICRRVGANVPLKIAKMHSGRREQCVWLETSSFAVCEPIVAGGIEI